MNLYWFKIVVVLLSLMKTVCYGGTTATEQPMITTLAPFPETLADAPCSDFRPDDLDFQTLDLIAAYGLDRANATGVTLVQGSQDLQRAYRISEGARLTMPLRALFPEGLPHHFGIVGTFSSRSQRRPWSLVRARTHSDTLEFALTLLPVSQRLAVMVQGDRVYFRCPKLFQSGWHKIHVGVSNHTVQAAVDCKRLEPETIGDYDFSNTTSISIVSHDDGIPASIDLQWLSMSCDAYNATTEDCEEIESPESLIKASSVPPSYGLQASSIENMPLVPVCNGSCPPGPIGPEGPKGMPGDRGFTGLPGIRGRDGNPGPVGAQGLKGDKGERGEPGVYFNGSGIHEGLPGQKGDKGEKGELGESGPVGFSGLPGSDGKDGARGPPGPMGQPGIPGTPGGFSNINASLLHGAKGERGAPGSPGRDGSPGARGIPGFDGAPGVPGLDGAPGLPGIPGERGPVGPQGERGYEGRQGPKGPKGQPGPPGPPGTSLSQGTAAPGIPGPPGERGERGEPGAPGYPGKDGLNGIPGPPGQRGPPGVAALVTQPIQAPSITEKDVQNICEDLIRARLAEMSANLVNLVPATSMVRRGPPGRPGPAGTPGSQGLPGEPGPRGYPGETGEPGRPGSPGANGSKGDKGDRGPAGVGLPGPEGPRGLSGPVGPPGPEGRMGARGDPGREGPMGPRGVRGPMGTCDCATASAYYAYAPQMNNKGPQ